MAKTCRAELGLILPTLIDDLRNSTDAAYSGWPDRLFLVGQGGKIAYRGGRGPRGFKPAELEAAIEKALGTQSEPARSKEELDAVRERLRKKRQAELEKKE